MEVNMDGVGALGQMVEIEALIQSKVAEFLALKLKLVELRRHSDISVKARAEGLLGVQQRLEVELKVVLEKIELFKTGVWQSAIEIIDFGQRMIRHMSKVNALRRDAGQTGATQAMFGVDWKILAIPLAILAVPFVSRLLKR